MQCERLTCVRRLFNAVCCCRLLCAGFEERYAEERSKLAVTGERLAKDMLDAESTKLRAIMTSPGASVQAVEVELKR